MIFLLMLAAVTPDCHFLGHDRILGSDLAAASAPFAGMPPELVVGNAPRPGMRRIFEPAELIRIARANHLEPGDVEALCFERATSPLDPERIKAAMKKSFGDTQASIEILTISQFPAPDGDMIFPREALMAPASGDTAVWNGYVAYQGGRFPIWARVRLTVMQSRLVAVMDLAAGHVLEPADLRMEQAGEFPRRIAPLATIEAAVGLAARHAIPAGSALTAAMLDIPNDVERGQTVLVEVQSGGAILKLEAKAESAGRRGATIGVRNATSGTLFRAQIEGKGRVVVKCRSLSEVSQ